MWIKLRTAIPIHAQDLRAELPHPSRACWLGQGPDEAPWQPPENVMIRDVTA